MSKPEIGFIGAGNMGSAIINSLKNDYTVYVSRKNKDKLAEMTGINPCNDNSAAVKDITFLAVKPNIFKDILPEIKESLIKNNSILISMAAGISIASIEETLGCKVKIIRIMPNVNASVGMSVTAVCANDIVAEEDLISVKEILAGFGTVTDVSENLFPVFSAIAGCSPAFVYAFIDALARGAQKMGMNKEQAIKIAASAVKGSACMLESNGGHPQSLVDMVCSPGGTTIEGICTLEEYKFTPGIVKAVENIVNKDKKLSD